MKRSFTFISNLYQHVMPGTKKTIISVLFATAFMAFSLSGNSQITVALHKETFPNTSNTVLASPINQSFAGSTGTWQSYSNNAKATVGCFPAAYSPVTNAVKLVMLTTTGAAAADAIVTSPVYNFGNPGCNGKYDISFKLYTYNCAAGDNNAYIALDFSNDGGSTWTVMWQQTSGQLNASYGINAIPEIWLAIGSQYNTPNFRYRFRGHNNAGNANPLYLFLDDITLYSWACTDVMNLGNLVWLDTNLNGLKDGSETGVSGITVQLTRDNDADGINDGDFTPRTTTTNATGNYLFTNLGAGKYQITLTNVSTLMRVVPTNAGAPDEDGDNNNNGTWQSSTFVNVSGGWITLLPQSEPTNDGDGNNGNLTYDLAIVPASALPIKAIHVKATLVSETISIDWSTVNEINTDHFDVERSTDNRQFEKIATKQTTALYGGNASYKITDDISLLNTDIIYYRIRVTDKDGKFYFSEVEVIRPRSKGDISVWPNPFVSNVKVSYQSSITSKVIVKLIDNSGKVVKMAPYTINKGANQIVMDGLDNLPKGVYLLTVVINDGNVIASGKIMK